MNEQRAPKAWVDLNTHAIVFRGDVSADEARELQLMLHQAFNAGITRAAEILRPEWAKPA